ncbi:hypothetical protein PPYR_13453 [Photinus pyralis]|uniref:Uncharacterized protein n=1 Tax=Photinus pyralis TaxID=7054 RepID=A0A1Y1NMK7_PHOPY|nr:hypothetical protein PPYR_13453 [Photinus pyralis]
MQASIVFALAVGLSSAAHNCKYRYSSSTVPSVGHHSSDLLSRYVVNRPPVFNPFSYHAPAITGYNDDSLGYYHPRSYFYGSNGGIGPSFRILNTEEEDGSSPTEKKKKSV